jgi:hypothetical protein
MSAEELERIKSYALSNDDINDILGSDTKVFTYPKFFDFEHIDEAFDREGRCVFLFLTQDEHTGHWLCMFKRPEGIEYFDSYGDKPDAQRSWLSEEKLEELGEGEPRLTELLRASGQRVYYSTCQYQVERSDVSSCGRWCATRLLCKDMSNLQFFNFVKEQMKELGLTKRDDWVSLFTFQQLGK